MTQDVELLTEEHVAPVLPSKKALRKPTYDVNSAADRGLGRNAYSDKYIADYLAQPHDKKGRISRTTWADTAYVLVLRAKTLSQTVSKKDFNALYRLILSAGIAFDKAWPTQSPQSTGNLVVQLFGSLPQVELRSIVQPLTPTCLPQPSTTTDVDATDVETT